MLLNKLLRDESVYSQKWEVEQLKSARRVRLLASEQNSVYCTSSYIVYVSAYEVSEAGLEREQPRAELTNLVLSETARGRALSCQRSR